jgi:hypothetical protein
MLPRFIAVVGIALLAAMIVFPCPAADNAPESREKKTVKTRSMPIHGKLAAVDKQAKTITVGESVLWITDETKIFKDGKPATLDDAVKGEPVVATYRAGADKKREAMMIRFGPKPDGKSP